MSVAPLVVPADRLNALERGIALPVVYASLFGAPVTRHRLHGYVAGVRATRAEVETALEGPGLRALLRINADDVWLASASSAETRARFMERRVATRELLQRNAPILNFVQSMPRVKFAALSGGCAHDTADDGDIDVFAIADRDAVWRVLLRTMTVSKARGWRRLLCLNYLVDETSMALPWRDFYGGFELISLKPIRGAHWFPRLVGANPWVETVFPNFLSSMDHGQNSVNDEPAASRPGFEFLARMIQRSYLRYRLAQGSGVELSNHSVRLHTRDHRLRLRGLFQDALQRIGMEAPPWI